MILKSIIYGSLLYPFSYFFQMIWMKIINSWRSWSVSVVPGPEYEQFENRAWSWSKMPHAVFNSGIPQARLRRRQCADATDRYCSHRHTKGAQSYIGSWWFMCTWTALTEFQNYVNVFSVSMTCWQQYSDDWDPGLGAVWGDWCSKAISSCCGMRSPSSSPCTWDEAVTPFLNSKLSW